MKILAVDDDEVALEILRATLVNANYTDISVANSASEALKLIEASKDAYDCFLLDIAMPGMDGIELCQTLRDSGQHTDIPIVMITAMADQKHIDRAFSAGATDYVTKPFNGLELGARIRSASVLSATVKTEREARKTAESLEKKLKDTHQITLSKRFDLDDTPNAFDVYELENYLLKLPTGNHETILAFRISNIEDIFRRLLFSTYRNMVNSVANCIVKSIDSVDMKITYAGNGTFVCVDPKIQSFTQGNIADTVNSAVNKVKITDQNNNPVEILLMVGQPTSATFWVKDTPDVGIMTVIQDLQSLGEDGHSKAELKPFKTEMNQVGETQATKKSVEKSPTPFIRHTTYLSKTRQQTTNRPDK